MDPERVNVSYPIGHLVITVMMHKAENAGLKLSKNESETALIKD
jgi:hypothetical protein